MGRGRNNQLVGQVAEHLVCAELGRLGLCATGFAGNIPTFDVLATDEKCRTVPIQVKATTARSWRSNARVWMDITVDPDGLVQKLHGPRTLQTPDLIYACVMMAAAGSKERDRFFVITMRELQQLCIKSYCAWMTSINWRRPRNPHSFDLRYYLSQLEPFENNWALVQQRLANSEPDPSLANAAPDTV
jgi:hypothetical protein